MLIRLLSAVFSGHRIRITSRNITSTVAMDISRSSHITTVPKTVTADSYFPMKRSCSYQTLDIIFTVCNSSGHTKVLKDATKFNIFGFN